MNNRAILTRRNAYGVLADIMDRVTDPEYLLPNFRFEELACRCGCGLGMRWQDYDPWALVSLDELRIMHGEPITVNCGCRCITHNRRVQERNNQAVNDNSFHVKCAAFDLASQNEKQRSALLLAAMQVRGFHDGGCGIYSWGLHLDTGPGRRWKG